MNNIRPLQFTYGRIVIAFCLISVWYFSNMPISADDKKSVVMDLTANGTLSPKITHAWVAFHLIEGWTDPPYPRKNDAIEPRVFVKATYQGSTHLYVVPFDRYDPILLFLDSHANNWSVVGLQGPDNNSQFISFPTLQDASSRATIEVWNTTLYGETSVTTYKMMHKCTAFDGVHGRKYGYDKTVGPIRDGIGIPSPGVSRYVACVSNRGNTVYSPSKENATRFAIRESNNFGLTNEKRRDFTQWAFAYLGAAYEWQGLGFGGKESKVFEKRLSYNDGFGVDCSGFVSCAAKWAGYNWHTGYPGYTWAYSTQAIPGVTTDQFPANDPFGPGDILIKEKKHVNIVYFYDQATGQIRVIEAFGVSELAEENAAGTSLVRVRGPLSLQNIYTNKGYSKRRLVEQ